MSFRAVLLLSGMLLASRAVAGDKVPTAPELCHQSIAMGRTLWLKGAMEAPPDMVALMVNVIDGKLAQARQQLKDMPPVDARRWRQFAFITAVYAGQSGVVEGLLDDGADVNGISRMPPYKPGFFGKVVGGMKHDSRFGGPGAVNGMAKAGLLENRGQLLGPALPAAAWCGDMATVTVLLRHHADMAASQAQHIGGALVPAVVQGNAPMVRRLLDHGADPCVFDRQARERMLRIHRPYLSLAQLGHRNSLPALLTQRLACPSLAAVR